MSQLQKIVTNVTNFQIHFADTRSSTNWYKTSTKSCIRPTVVSF